MEIHPEARCPLCGAGTFVHAQRSAPVICGQCGSTERVRVTRLFLDRLARPTPGMRIAHFAPEESLATYLLGIVGAGYEPYNLSVQRYDFVDTKPFDLCTDIHDLPTGHYDLVIHNHVLEHLPCNYTMTLLHLHRALKPDGYHLFSIPFADGAYAEDLSPLPAETRRARFTQEGHIRRFGRDTVAATLGMIFRLPQPYRLIDHFDADTLARANIQKGWYRPSGASVFCLGRQDLRL